MIPPYHRIVSYRAVVTIFFINCVCICVCAVEVLFDYSGDPFPIATFHVVIKLEQSFKIIKNDKYNRKTLFVSPKTYLTSIDLMGHRQALAWTTSCSKLSVYYLRFIICAFFFYTHQKKKNVDYIYQFGRKIVNIFAISFGETMWCVYFCFRFAICQICQLNSPWQYRLAYRRVCSLWNDCFGVFLFGRTVIRKTISSLSSNNKSRKKVSGKSLKWEKIGIRACALCIHLNIRRRYTKNTQIKICAHKYQTEIYCIKTRNIADKKKIQKREVKS